MPTLLQVTLSKLAGSTIKVRPQREEGAHWEKEDNGGVYMIEIRYINVCERHHKYRMITIV